MKEESNINFYWRIWKSENYLTEKYLTSINKERIKIPGRPEKLQLVLINRIA